MNHKENLFRKYVLAEIEGKYQDKRRVLDLASEWRSYKTFGRLNHLGEYLIKDFKAVGPDLVKAINRWEGWEMIKLP